MPVSSGGIGCLSSGLYSCALATVGGFFEVRGIDIPESR